MAYYRNYKSKDDILTDIFDDFMTKLTEISLPYMQTKQWYDYWKVLFDFDWIGYRRYWNYINEKKKTRIGWFTGCIKTDVCEW